MCIWAGEETVPTSDAKSDGGGQLRARPWVRARHDPFPSTQPKPYPVRLRDHSLTHVSEPGRQATGWSAPSRVVVAATLGLLKRTCVRGGSD